MPMLSSWARQKDFYTQESRHKRLSRSSHVKSMDGGAVEALPKGDGKGKGPEKTGKGPTCKFFGTEDGCKKGEDCTYVHDWSTLDKSVMRCWTCSSTKHSKKDCTVKAMSSSSGAARDAGGKGRKGGGDKGKPPDSNPTLKKFPRF